MKVCLLITLLCITHFSRASAEEISHYSISDGSQTINFDPPALLKAELTAGELSLVVIEGTVTEGCRAMIDLKGTIGPDSSYLVRKVLSDACNDKPPVIWLNSTGGLLYDGIELGSLANEIGATFYLGRGPCASACAIAFIKSKKRVALENAVLELHSPYLEKKGTVQCVEIRQLKNLFKERLGDKDGTYVYRRMQDYCGRNQVWRINADTMLLLGIIKKVGF